MATDTALVTITVDATVEANADTATTSANTPVTVPILANDIVNGVTGPTVDDLNGPPTILSITPEDAGTATVNVDGEIEFTPAAGFCGQVQVEYSIERTCQASCAGFVIEFDDRGWGPRNILVIGNMSNLPDGFSPGGGEDPLVLSFDGQNLTFYWNPISGWYINNDYVPDSEGEEWPSSSFTWPDSEETCVDITFLPADPP